MEPSVREMTTLIWNHPANAGHRVRALSKAAAWQAYKRTIRRPFDLRVFDTMHLRAYPDSHQPGRIIYYNGLPDFEEMLFIRRYLRPGDRFIDGGANVGLYTLLAASIVGPTGHVDTFEASPPTGARLRENVERNSLSSYVTVHACALAEEEGTVTFTIGRAATVGDRIARVDDADLPTATVPTTTLDTLPSVPYAMAALDIEGAEPLALRGAQRLLSENNPPVWQLELVDKFVRRFGFSADDVVEMLHEAGYVLAGYDPKANELAPDDSKLGHTRCQLAISKARWDEVVDRLRESATPKAAPSGA
jgi:FkbM family methyltransferase